MSSLTFATFCGLATPWLDSRPPTFFFLPPIACGCQLNLFLSGQISNSILGPCLPAVGADVTHHVDV